MGRARVLGIAPACFGAIDATEKRTAPAARSAEPSRRSALSLIARFAVEQCAAARSITIFPEARRFIDAAGLVLIVLAGEPAAFMDAYALMKALALENDRREFLVVANMVANDAEGARLFDQFAGVAGRFLDVALTHAGSIPADPCA